MIRIQRVTDLPFPTVCYGCGRKNDDKGVRIEAKSPDRPRGEILYLCGKCRKELSEKLCSSN